MHRPLLALAVLAAVAGMALAPARTVAAEPVTVFSAYELTPKYGPDYRHWDYVNPEAPKGGDLVLGAFGTFDSLNSYIVRGTPAVGTDAIYDSLVTTNGDEVEVYYAYVAESVEIADDWSWMIFNLRRDARFHDGQPITAEDVVFTHETLRDKGAPRFKTRFYTDVTAIEALDTHRVRIAVRGPEAKQTLIALATFPIFPKHWWEGREFDQTSLEPPLGSGPYRIARVDPGRSITYERVADYWAADHPANRGQNNFDTIRYDYYRDTTVMFEALKAGRIDFMSVTSSQEWSTGFEGLRPVAEKRLILEEIPSQDPESFVGFWFNLRRPQFQDIRVREALTQLYDFETAQRTVHYGLYERTRSYFPNTEMSATGLPQGIEMEILEPFRGKIPEHIFTEEFRLPQTAGDGNIRANLRRAMSLFREAGLEIRNGVLTHVASGQPMTFEILYRSPNMEKVILPLVRNFERAGIRARPRLVDTAQFVRRLDEFDFDIVHLGITPFYPPGTPLRSLWRSDSANERGAENFTGIKDPVLDALVEEVVAAEEWDRLVGAVKALDRYLLWQYLAIPTYFDNSYRIAYWDMFGRPDTKPRYGLGFPGTWWYDPSNPRALRGNR